MRNGESPDAGDGVSGFGQHRELTGGQVAVVDVRDGEQPGRRELRFEECDASRFVEGGVVAAHARRGDEFGDHLLVHPRVLAHVESAEVGAEHDHRPTDGLDLRPGEFFGAVRRQRCHHDVEIVDELVDRLVRLPGDAGRSRVDRLESTPQDALGEGVQPGVHAAQGAAVGLVGPER